MELLLALTAARSADVGLQATTLPIEQAQEHPPLIISQNLAVYSNAAFRYCSFF